MDNEKKEGVSVKEIHEFTKNHRLEVFFCLVFLFACLFNFVFIGGSWSIITAAAGAIIGVLLPGKVEHFSKSIFHFVFKQENTTQIIIGVAVLIITIFLPILTFFALGLHGGKSMFHLASEICSLHKK